MLLLLQSAGLLMKPRNRFSRNLTIIALIMLSPENPLPQFCSLLPCQGTNTLHAIEVKYDVEIFLLRSLLDLRHWRRRGVIILGTCLQLLPTTK